MTDINGLRLYPEEAISAIASTIRVKTSKYTISQIASGITNMPIGNIGDYSTLYSIMNRNISGIFSNSTVSKVRSFAFYGCSGGLSSVAFPNAVELGTSAFAYCTSLQYVSFPNVTRVESYCFQSDANLVLVALPKCTYIGSSAFYYCSSKLRSVSLPMCTEIFNYAFYGCYKLSEISLPSVSMLYPSAFGMCSSLLEVSAPLVESVGTQCFVRASLLESAVFPKCTYIGGYAFSGCSNLSTVDLSIFSGSLQAYTFGGCTRLMSLYLRNSSTVVTLPSINAFNSTPLYNYSGATGGWGKIYVPNALLNSYKTATNWVTISNMISGI